MISNIFVAMRLFFVYWLLGGSLQAQITEIGGFRWEDNAVIWQHVYEQVPPMSFITQIPDMWVQDSVVVGKTKGVLPHYPQDHTGTRWYKASELKGIATVEMRHDRYRVTISNIRVYKPEDFLHTTVEEKSFLALFGNVRRQSFTAAWEKEVYAYHLGLVSLFDRTRGGADW